MISCDFHVDDFRSSGWLLVCTWCTPDKVVSSSSPEIHPSWKGGFSIDSQISLGFGKAKDSNEIRDRWVLGKSVGLRRSRCRGATLEGVVGCLRVFATRSFPDDVPNPFAEEQFDR